jgi:hypothetical protein
MRMRRPTGTVRPFQVRIREEGLGPQILGGDDERLEAELTQRDLKQALVLKVAEPPGRQHVGIIATAITAPKRDDFELYLLGRNIRRRNLADRADFRIEARLDKRTSKRRMPRRDRGSRLGGKEGIGSAAEGLAVERAETLATFRRKISNLDCCR